jgi:hypothetical protein
MNDSRSAELGPIAQVPGAAIVDSADDMHAPGWQLTCNRDNVAHIEAAQLMKTGNTCRCSDRSGIAVTPSVQARVRGSIAFATVSALGNLFH